MSRSRLQQLAERYRLWAKSVIGEAAKFASADQHAATNPINAVELESRVLYSAAPIPIDALVGQADAVDDPLDVTMDLTAALEPVTFEEPALEEPLFALPESDESFFDTSTRPADESVESQEPIELVFVDAGVPAGELLAAQIAQKSPNVQIFRIDADQDGIEFISSVLDRHQNVGAVHVLSHGQQGEVSLGNTVLSNDNIDRYSQTLGSWATGLTADADLLIYGCELGGSAEGESLIKSLAAKTGADVAASTDLTGHADLGGDWDLEFNVGAIESSVIVSSALQRDWHHVLETTETHLFLTGNSIPIGELAGDLPTNLAIPDYDNGRHSPVGTLVDPGGSGADETDARQVLGFDVAVAGADINGPVELRLWSHIEDFDAEDGATVTAYLVHTDGTGNDVQIIESRTITRGEWNPNSGWVEDRFDFGRITTTLDSGRVLGVRLVVDGSSDAGIVFGYDSIFYRSSLILGEDTVNLDPLVSVGLPLDYSGATGPQLLLPGLELQDDDATQQWAVVQFSENFNPSQDRLSVSGPLPTGLSVDIDNATGQLVISGVASTADYEDVLSRVEYENTAGSPNRLIRELQIQVYDGQNLTETNQRISFDQILVVDTTSNVVDGDTSDVGGLLSDRGADGQLSLREAIEAANSATNPGGRPIQIYFAIPDSDANRFYYRDDGIAGSLSLAVRTTLADTAITDFDPDYPYEPFSWFRIAVEGGDTTRLRVSNEMLIDGYSQAGSRRNSLDVGTDAIIRIELVQADAVNAFGLDFEGGSDGSSVAGLAINRFGRSGIQLNAGPISVEGNFIGTDVTGTVARANAEHGIHVLSDEATIGGSQRGNRNLISGNGLSGIVLDDGGSGARDVLDDVSIVNNYIGVDATGTVSLGNTFNGITVDETDGLTIRSNLISGNGSHGLFFVRGDGGVDAKVNEDVTIQGNLIGTDGTGTLAVGNAGAGIRVEGVTLTDATIGGTNPGEGNVLSGNLGGFSMGLLDFSPTNQFRGIVSDTRFVGNFIGTDRMGTVDLGNAFHGIQLTKDATDNLIGGIQTGEANVIANNGQAGVAFDASVGGGNGYGNTIRGNRIFNNGGLGIDLTAIASPGVTPNDGLIAGEYDRDDGPNRLQNFPELSLASYRNGDLQVEGILNGRPNTDYVLDFYVSQSPDASGHGEAERYLGQAFLPRTNSMGRISFQGTLPDVTINHGEVLTATATYLTGGDGSTSEFSENILIDVNLAPTITSDLGGDSAAINVAENSTEVTTVTASDPEQATADLSYSITGGADQALFTIDAVTGELSFVSLRDFENPTDADVDGTYEVEVSVEDGETGTDVQSLSVTITNVNEAPTITSDGGGASASINTAENTTVVTTVTATDPEQTATDLSYSITGGADQSLFTIDAGTGALSFVSLRDFENATDVGNDGTYEVEVTVDDGLTGTDAQSLSVTLTNINEAPTITSNGGGNNATVNVAENTTAVTTVTATDPEQTAADLSYSISGGADQSLFTIDAGTGALSFISLRDFENATDVGNDGTYEIQVTVDDGLTGTDVQSISVTLTNINEAPTITSNGGGNNATANVAENTTAVTTIIATDPEQAAADLSYSISGGADQSLFTIDAATGALSFVSMRDFENAMDVGNDGTYEVEVTVDDGLTGTDVQSLSVAVTNVNEAPTITSNGGGASASINTAENTTVVTTVTATDPEQAAADLTYSISGGADQSLFTIDTATGALSFVSLRDFENATDADNDGTYEVQVTVDDGLTGTDVQSLSVAVTNINEAPTITSNGGGNSATVNVAENTTAVTTIIATDPEQTAADLSYSITGGADQSLFDIDAATGALSFVSLRDFESATDAGNDGTYEVQVTVDDGLTGTDVQSLSVAVTNINEAPTIISNGGGNSAAVNVAENTTTVTTVAANDPEQAAADLSYAITGGADQSLFAIDSATGELSFVSLLDFENATDSNNNGVYEVQVTADDGLGGTDVQSLSVTLTNINEAPTINSNGGGNNAAVNVAENTTVVTTVNATDPEQAATDLSYSISGGADQALFNIDAATGALSFVSLRDFENATDVGNDGTYEVEVTVDDGLSATDVQSLSVTLTNVNEAPTTVVSVSTASTDEDAAPTTFDLPGLFDDVDNATGDLRYSLVGNNNTSLVTAEVVGDQLQFTLEGDQFGVAEIRVRVTDPGNLSSDAMVTLNVNSVNDAPIVANNTYQQILIGADQPLSITGNILNGATDVELDDLFIVSATTPTSGNLVLNPDGSFVFTPEDGFSGSLTFEFVASDGIDQSQTGIATLVVSDLGTPVITPSEPDDSSEEDEEETLVLVEPGTSDESKQPNEPAAAAPLELNSEGIVKSAPVEEDVVDEEQATELVFGSALTNNYAFSGLTTTNIVSRSTHEASDNTWQYSPEFMTSLNQLGDDLDGVSQTLGLAQWTTVVSASTVSIGFAAYVLRAGAIVASMMVNVPAWRMVDPLAVLGYREDEQESEESLLDIVEGDSDHSEPTDVANAHQLAPAGLTKTLSTTISSPAVSN